MNQIVKLNSETMPYSINEDFKVLRTNLQFLGIDKKVLLFTSTIGGEGKSTISYELARSLAAIEKKVLFIDCDLRKSTFEKRVISEKNLFSIEYGMSHYLSSQAEMDEVIYPTDTDGLDIVFAGPYPPNPAELLSNSRMSQLLQAMKDTYDYILIDAAPVGLVTDAFLIAPHCDGIILVVETDKIRYRIAQTTTKRLEATKCPILGVILNKVPKGKGYYYHKYYGKDDSQSRLKRLLNKKIF